MTIWWPRSGVKIYRLVTGVTSVVDVPSTHLVSLMIRPNVRNHYKLAYFLEIHTLCQYSQETRWYNLIPKLCVIGILYACILNQSTCIVNYIQYNMSHCNCSDTLIYNLIRLTVDASEDIKQNVLNTPATKAQSIWLKYKYQVLCYTTGTFCLGLVSLLYCKQLSFHPWPHLFFQ